jgi:enoyl-CoA hydratase/carnithine racemase
MMSASEPVLYAKEDGVAWITLNRPDALNIYNLSMRDALAEVLEAIERDDEVWAVVLRGAGRGFSAGADLTEFGSTPPVLAREVRFARDVWATLVGLRVPKIAAMHGFAFGSGLEMALFCDIRLAADGTRFGFPEVRMGMIPAAGGTQTFPRQVSEPTALDLVLTGRHFYSAEALHIGLIHQVVDAKHLDAAVRTVLAKLRGFSPAAVRAMLRAIREGRNLPLRDGLRLEARLAATLRQ